MVSVDVEKDENTERPVPTAWRAILARIADAFTAGEAPTGDDIRKVESKTLLINVDNIGAYPDAIGRLAEETWKSSVYIWALDHWEVLVDLSTTDGKSSDLVLHVDVYEAGENYEFEPGLIYVP